MQMAQSLAEALITMMQATSDQKLTVLDGARGPQYIVEMPPVAPRANGVTLDLYQARAVIDGSDFHIEAFEASGALLKQPYSVSFKLIRRDVRPSSSVPATEFEIQPGPEDVILDGGPSDHPVVGLLATVLREVGRLRGN